MLLVWFALDVVRGEVGPSLAAVASAVWWLTVLRADRIGSRSALALAAVLHALLALSSFQSNDLHRYLWEGHVQLAGASPYAVPPDDPSLAPLRDERFERVAHPELTTVYPPLAQASFALTALLGGEERSYRNAVIAGNLLLCWSILAWLRATGRPPGRVALYAWCPTALLAATGGHIDVWMAVFLVGFAWAWEAHRWHLAGLALGAAVLAKTTAVLVVPWALWRAPRPIATTVVPLVALGYLPFVPDGHLAGSLSTFAADFRLNAPGFGALEAWLGAHAFLAAGALLLGVVLIATVRVTRPAEAIVCVLAALLLLAPVVHYWYLVWILALAPALGWSWLRLGVVTLAASVSATAPLYFAIAAGEPLPDATWLQVLAFGLPLLAIVCSVLRDGLQRRGSEADRDLAWETAS